jgi:uncharacterized protein (TIGR01777 family)
MHVIITGGTGLIGKPLTQLLAQAGHQVTVLSRNPAKHTLPPGIQMAQWDGQTAVGWEQAANSAHAIINLAGESIAGSGFPPPRWSAERKQRILQSRLDAGRAVVAAIRAADNKPAVVLQASGIDYYGNVPTIHEINEESPSGTGFLADVTRQWEASTAEVQEMGVRQILLRTGIVLSMEGGALPQTVMPFKFFAGGPLGNGKQWWPWIHLTDEIRAIQFLLEHRTASGAFNLCAPNPLPQKEFAQEIGRAMGRPALLPAPAFALRAMLGEMAAIVLDGRRAIPQRLQALGFTFQYPQATSALLDILNEKG